MRCVNPAGFPSKWLYLISMHGLGKRRPEAPLFNYVTILGGAYGGGGDDCKPGTVGREAGTAGFPEQCSLGDIQLQRCPERNRQEGSH